MVICPMVMVGSEYQAFVTVTTTKPVIIIHIRKRNIPQNVDGGSALSTKNRQSQNITDVHRDVQQ